MSRPPRLKVLSHEQLARLTEPRLLAYRRKALSLLNSADDADYSPAEIDTWDPSFVWFKSDPRWQAAYELILEELARVQSQRQSG